MDGIALQAGMTRREGAAPADLDPLVEDFAARLAVEGYTLAGGRLAAYDAFIKAGASHGWLEHVIEAYPFEGTAVGHAKVKLIAKPGESTDLNNYQFLDIDVDENGGMNQVTPLFAVWTTFNGNLLSNIAGVSMWLRDRLDLPAFTVGMGWPNGVYPYFCLSIQGGIYSIWGAESPSIAPGITAGRGLYRMVRPSLSSLEVWANDQLVGSHGTTISDSRPSQEIWVGQAPLPFDFGAIDDGTMSAAESTAFAEDVGALMVALGRLPRSSDVLYVPGMGQSLAMASQGEPALSTTPDPEYATGRPLYGYYSGTGAVHGPAMESTAESVVTSMLNTNAKLRRDEIPGSVSFDCVGAVFGAGGADYNALKKGSIYYGYLLSCITSAKAAHDITHPGTFRVPAVFIVHGEADISSPTYQADLEEWQADLEADINAITGRSDTIPLIHSQPSSWTYDGTISTALSPYGILAAHLANPTKHLIAGAKYFVEHAPDGVHLINTSYRTIGSYYGKALNALMRHQESGANPLPTPLRPYSITRVADVITITFAGRVGSLVLDTTAVSNPGNYGFEVTGGGSIVSVAIVGHTIELTVSGTIARVRYAYTGTPGASGGPTTGPRGNLRDSDTAEDYNGDPMPNWCVHFDHAVGYLDPVAG